jgi:hypothetical protein
MKLFSMALLLALTCDVAIPVRADVILPAAVGSVLCNSNSPVVSMTDPSACELEGIAKKNLHGQAWVSGSLLGFN